MNDQRRGSLSACWLIYQPHEQVGIDILRLVRKEHHTFRRFHIRLCEIRLGWLEKMAREKDTQKWSKSHPIHKTPASSILCEWGLFHALGQWLLCLRGSYLTHPSKFNSFPTLSLIHLLHWALSPTPRTLCCYFLLSPALLWALVPLLVGRSRLRWGPTHTLYFIPGSLFISNELYNFLKLWKQNYIKKLWSSFQGWGP